LHCLTPILSLQKVTINSSSQKREEVTIVLTVDESALTNLEKAGYGGLIRKHGGNFLLTLFGSVGILNILHVEIQVL